MTESYSTAQRECEKDDVHQHTLCAKQLPLGLIEAQVVQHTGRAGFAGYSTLNTRASAAHKLAELVVPAERLPWVIERGLRDFAGHDVYISQHSYAAPARRTEHLLSLNVAHLDLDVYSTTWGRVMPNVDLAALADTLIARMRREGLMLPSYIVASGRGLQAKWLWDAPLTPKALPRWQAAHRWMLEQPVFKAFGADPKAVLPTQIMRLVGSVNTKNGEPVRVVWCDGSIDAPAKRDFDAFCAVYLPYTRAQVREFQALHKQYRIWDAENDANRAIAAAAGLGRPRANADGQRAAWDQLAGHLGISVPAVANLGDLVGGEIWHRRRQLMGALALQEYGPEGVPAGLRHDWAWVAANAFGWVNREQKQPLLADLVAWCGKYLPGYTAAEVRSAAGAVLSRERKGSDMYRMHESTFLAKLGVSASAFDQVRGKIAAAKAQRHVNEGAMGFEKMRGLTPEAYAAETTRRQRESGRWSAANRSSTHSDETKARARAMRAEGMTMRKIGELLCVSQGSVAAWCKT